MMKRKGKIFVGTSGWSYKHWIGRFYPAETKDAQQLSYYLKFFRTVELNNSFYHLPPPTTFSNWRKNTPADFIFSVKASRFISHMKKLNVEKGSIKLFFSSVNKLKEKLGPILFQLPPKWNINAERLELFLKKLPKKNRYTFEFRNQTWYENEVYEILKKHNAAFCIYELEHHLSPLEVTADFVYIRLHGPGMNYQGSYKNSTLQQWADRCNEWRLQGKDVYVYFDNDQLGYAAFNALQLKKLLEENVSSITRARIKSAV